ncbi:Icc-related predicted phosphoesterase [Edaphobacter aggregans]|uniref:Icc-related predicted phosphoesterase n=1 Tax=Edaphobacter aggregans TaxID=570835 RepID=A0A428ML83_9BACT|nr:Icc-related predicted phosphoesterase [Edaphobacter aggregans]
MVLVLFGDTHELHREVEVPAGDILICVGDFTMFSRSFSAIVDFNEWLGELPHRHKIVVPGNHEFFLESNPKRRGLLDNAHVLLDEGIEIEGLRFYGSPMTPLYGAAFGKSSPNDRERHWSKVPDDTHVLVTHGPPFGILDVSPDQADRMGDPELRNRVRELSSLKLHAFGHIHGAHGAVEQDGVTFANVALMGHLGDLVQAPTVLRMTSRRT